jgi:hypothetical protein
VVRAVKGARRVYVGTALAEGRFEHFQVTKVEALFRLSHLTNAAGDIRCEMDEKTGSVILGGK